MADIQRRSIPEHSPLDGGTIICSGCGKEMKMTVKIGRRGVEHLHYECINEESGCSYGFDRCVYVNAELHGIRQDGTTAIVPDARA